MENGQSVAKEFFKGRVAPYQIMEKGIMVGLDVVGEKFESGDYFFTNDELRLMRAFKLAGGKVA